MIPEQWNQKFATLPPRKLKKIVEREARIILSKLEPKVKISTEQLVESLYPREISYLTLEGDNARTGIYRLIGQLAAEGLDDCCVKGKVNGQFMGKPKRPWLWFRCEPEEVCEFCGQSIEKDEI